MRITGIERQKRHPERVNVYVDGGFAFGLSEEVWLKSGLRKGDTVPPEMVRSLTASEEETRARQSALRLLNYRMRTEKELRDRLLEKEFPPAVVDGVITSLTRLGLINDPEFARMYLRDARLRKPAGKRLLMQNLRRRGVPADIIRSVMEEAEYQESDDTAALAAARQAMRRYRSSIRKTDRRKEKERLARFLARRGFSWSTISPVLKALFPGDRTEDEA